jgi:hypothetical protein
MSQLPTGYKRKPFPTLETGDKGIKTFVVDEFQRLENMLTNTNQNSTTTRTDLLDLTVVTTGISASLANANASIVNEQTVRASADSALASDITTITATVTQQGTDLVAAEAQIVSERTARATADSAIATDVTTLTATVNQQGTDIAATQASVTSESTARANADSALASDVTTLTATVNQQGTAIAATQASVTSESTARANADSAIASDVTTLTATVNQQGTAIAATQASVTSEQTARANADSAIASDVSSLTATVNQQGSDIAAAQSSITSEQTARASADSALATDITNLTATVNSGLSTNSAAITAEQTARANADSANASSINTVSASVTSEANARAAGDTAEANARIAADNAITASVATEASVRAAADNTLLAKYGVTLNSNGYITGFSQNNNGTTGNFKILADRFTIIDPAAAGSGLPGTQVFDITNGVVTMSAARIDNLTVGNIVGVVNQTSAFSGSAFKTFGPSSSNYRELMTVDCPGNSAKAHIPSINMVFDAAFATDTAYVKLESAVVTNGSAGSYTEVQTLRHKTAAGGNSWTTIPVVGSLSSSTTSTTRFRVSIKMFSDNGTGTTNQSRSGTAHWSGTTTGIV